MSNPSTNGEPSSHVEKLLESANFSSQTVAVLHVAFMAFVAYLAVIVWGTTHEDLLRIKPVKLPILDVELPLTTFYGFVPWLLVLLHFNLLMQLELLSCKLWNLDSNLSATPTGQQVRDRLFIFPFTHFIAGRSSVRLIRWLLSLMVGLTVIALPLCMLLAAQIRFLPFHDETITWSQRLAVWLDIAILLALWPLIASPTDHALEWWRNLGFRLFGYWLAWPWYWGTSGWNRLTRLIQRRWPRFRWLEIVARPLPQTGAEANGILFLLTSVTVVMLLSILAVIPGGTTVQTYYDPPKEVSKDTPHYFEDWLIRHLPDVALQSVDYFSGACTSLAPVDKSKGDIRQVMLGWTCAWFARGFFPRNLSLIEARLVDKEVSLSLLTRALDQDKRLRDVALKEFDGLKLRKRDLRYANLSDAVLPKADLREVQLQGADLSGAQLQSANLKGAVLNGANLSYAQLQGAKTKGTRGLQLQGADLSGAQLQGVDLRGAQLQGADLSGAQLQGADLRNAVLDGANLSGAELEGVNWSQANLDGIFIPISYRKLNGVYLEHLQTKLEAILDPLLDKFSFAAFQERMERARKGLPPGESASQTGCYSEQPALLECEYNLPTQRVAYFTSVLNPKLVKLACSNAAIAKGIARLGYQMSIDDPGFDLVASLLKALDIPKSCTGLAALPEYDRQYLRFKQQEKETKLK